ncbi:hypothetical protein V8F06_000018 [Rhypophila decipiens]
MRQFRSEPETLEKVFEALPLLLRSFALQLGQPGSSKAQRDVMYFVHKYRLNLSKQFKESMMGLVEDDSAPHREATPVDSELTSSRINIWLGVLGRIAEDSTPYLETSRFEDEAISSWVDEIDLDAPDDGEVSPALR